MKSFRTRETIELGPVLARSGQGSVYRTTDPNVLAKIYNTALESERFDKLKVMLDFAPEDPTIETLQHISIAWPNDILLDGVGVPIGFLMPYIQNARELTHVYNASLRLQFAPRFNWYYLHHTAFNYASAVNAIHSKGYVVGDIKPQNILVNSRALISIIDCDSFQVTSPRSGLRYRCPVGTEGFTPRELLEELNDRPFANCDRSETHDRFGLGVIMYLLLFGRHPFMEGRWMGAGESPTPDQRVLRGLWLHNPNGEIAKDPGTISLNIVHPRVEACFRRCFGDGHYEPSLRPSAAEWRAALKSAMEDLVVCDYEPNHFRSKHMDVCYWCWRGSNFGVDIFSPTGRIPKV
jgi:DNA-binding helix-hairpin-helix protein with protein kinase domain